MTLPPKLQKSLKWLMLTVPIALLTVLWTTYPFSDTLLSQSVSLASLTPVQRSNIELAVRAINGTVIKSGEEFSFNRIVGPRTERRGYRVAPSYVGTASVSSEGGGICLVSSAVYQLALQAGLQIDERVPHSRTVKTVPPGFDATVWYGQADLRFKNTLPCPIQLSADQDRGSVTISLLGRRPDQFHCAELQRLVRQSTSSDLIVELMRRENGRLCLISRDHYRIGN